MYLVSSVYFGRDVIANKPRYRSRVHLTAQKVAEWSLLCSSLLSPALQTDLEYRPHHRPENSSPHRIRLPIHQPPLHLLLSRKLLPNFLLCRRLLGRLLRRPLRSWHRPNHLRHPPHRLRPPHLHAIHPLHGQSPARR